MEHAAALGADLGDRGAGRVVDEDIELRELLRGLIDVGPLLGTDAAHAEVADRDHGVRADQALGDFLARHLEREEANGVARGGGVERQVEGERRLTHGGAGADDDELALAEAHEHAVERREAGGHARGLATGGADLLGLVVGLDHELGQRLVARLDLAGRDLEQHALGPLDDLLGVGRGVVGERVDLVRGPDELAEHGVAAHDLGVVLPVDERERVAHELEDVRLAAHGVELVDAAQVVDERDGVDGDALLVHLDHRGIDGLVDGAVEVVGLELDLGFLDHIGREQHGGENVGLGILVLRESLRGRTVLYREPRLPVIVGHAPPSLI